jgi:hypothetical protein
MSDIVNVRDLPPGTRISLLDGAEAEIVSNPADGVWVFARYLASPDDPSRVGNEDMIFAQDIAAVLQGD